MKITVSCLLIVLLSNVVDLRDIRRRKRAVPPEPVYQGFVHKEAKEAIAKRVSSWRPKDGNNVWELSGQFEGDIMLPKFDNYKNAKSAKNVLHDPNFRWEECVVPYFIEEDYFTEDDLGVIRGGMDEYHRKTCCRFREYKEGDKAFLVIRGNPSGCWSFVGRRGGGQVVNLQTPGCVRHGIVVHEFLHALGFFHQQSASERDDYVNIVWDNIRPGREHNFNKYNSTVVTNYGTGYDYSSIMHYSKKAFSKNGMDTIEPLEPGAKIGQRTGLSKKDIIKLEHMYSCSNHKGRYGHHYWPFY